MLWKRLPKRIVAVSIAFTVTVLMLPLDVIAAQFASSSGAKD